jgi:hypothetical protein
MEAIQEKAPRKAPSEAVIQFSMDFKARTPGDEDGWGNAFEVIQALQVLFPFRLFVEFIQDNEFFLAIPAAVTDSDTMFAVFVVEMLGGESQVFRQGGFAAMAGPGDEHDISGKIGVDQGCKVTKHRTIME